MPDGCLPVYADNILLCKTGQDISMRPDKAGLPAPVKTALEICSLALYAHFYADAVCLKRPGSVKPGARNMFYFYLPGFTEYRYPGYNRRVAATVIFKRGALLNINSIMAYRKCG